jgi:hypothetical protein
MKPDFQTYQGLNAKTGGLSEWVTGHQLQCDFDLSHEGLILILTPILDPVGGICCYCQPSRFSNAPCLLIPVS